MEIDPIWTVAIGTAIGGIILSIYSLFKQYLRESRKDGESQKLSIASIIVGASGILLFGTTSIIGFLLGLIAVIRNKNKALAKIGIIVSIAT